MPPLLQLQKLPGIGDEGWKKVFVSFFGSPEDHKFMEKMHFGHPVARATSYCLLTDTF